MKALNSVFFGRNNGLSGAIALSIVLLIALGCTCGKSFNLGNLSSNSNSTSSNTSSSHSNSSSGNVFGGDDQDSSDADSDSATALVKETTEQFENAISTEDFSDLYGHTAAEFRKQYTEEQVKAGFSDFISQKDQVMPILSATYAMSPEITDGPSTKTVGSDTVLSVSGKYPTRPVAVTFKYEYVKREGEWQLLRIEVYLRK